MLYKLSMIVPVYNVEKHVAGCLRSLLSQNIDVTAVEVVIINDGSSDSSMDIVRSIDWQDWNVTIVDQINSGLSSARNVGIEHSKGEYIWFIDSDDSLEENCLPKILDILNLSYDAIGFNILNVNEATRAETVDHLCYTVYASSVINGTSFLLGKNNIGVSQRFIFGRRLIDNLRFRDGIFHEDIDFNVRAIIRADRIFLSADTPYRYLQRTSGSITSTPDIKRSFDLLKIAVSFMSENNTTPDLWKVIYSRFAAHSLRQAARLALHNKGSGRHFEFYQSFIKASTLWLVAAPIQAIISAKTMYYFMAGLLFAIFGALVGMSARLTSAEWQKNSTST